MAEPPQPGALSSGAIDERVVIEHDTSAMTSRFKNGGDFVERRTQYCVVIGDRIAGDASRRSFE